MQMAGTAPHTHQLPVARLCRGWRRIVSQLVQARSTPASRIRVLSPIILQQPRAQPHSRVHGLRFSGHRRQRALEKNQVNSVAKRRQMQLQSAGRVPP